MIHNLLNELDSNLFTKTLLKEMSSSHQLLVNQAIDRMTTVSMWRYLQD